MDYKELSQAFQPYAETLLREWFPNGKLNGREFVVGSLSGEPGKSLKFNLDKCFGRDFAGGAGFGDLISLYASRFGLTQRDAALSISERLGVGMSERRPPKASSAPDFSGSSAVYSYLDRDGSVLFYIARYEKPDGKIFIPFTWDQGLSAWVKKAWTKNRPLFGLELLAENKPILLVEGEKACLSARKFAPSYTVMTWPGGAKALGKVNFTPLFFRDVTLWPDADDAGRGAMDRLAEILSGRAKSVGVVDVSDYADGWDAADSGFTNEEEFQTWLIPRKKPFKQIVETPPDIDDKPRSQYQIWADLCLTKDGNGKPYQNEDNLSRVISSWPPFRDQFFYDEFSDVQMRNGKRITEHDIAQIQYESQRHIGLHKVKAASIHDALKIHFMRSRRNLAQELILSTTWDGIERIESFLSQYLGCEFSEYSCAISKNFWISLVARIFKPGCQVDNMLILEGAEGIRKTSALKIIGENFFAQANEQIGTKDFHQSLRGKFLIEIGELQAFRKADIKKIIAEITNRVDTYRPTHGRIALDFPRACIFVGTTNETTYLKEGMGLRRFWPIHCKAADTEAIERDRGQLFAEAYTKFKAGNTWWEMPKGWEEIVAERVDDDDPWFSEIANYCAAKEVVTTRDILLYALKFEDQKMKDSDTKRVASCLRKLGFERKVIKLRGVNTKTWKRNEG